MAVLMVGECIYAIQGPGLISPCLNSILFSLWVGIEGHICTFVVPRAAYLS